MEREEALRMSCWVVRFGCYSCACSSDLFRWKAYRLNSMPLNELKHLEFAPTVMADMV